MKKLRMVATLSVSGPQLHVDCSNVMRAMKSLGIAGDVTPNRTLVDGDEEPGCRVVIASRPSKEHAARLWERLRTECELTCAHLSVRDDVSEGCVLDVLRPSRCPGRVQNTNERELSTP